MTENQKAGSIGKHNQRKIVDWLSNPPSEILTSFQNFVVSRDWAQTSIGPIEAWPPQLRQMVLLIMNDPEPAAVFWGEDSITPMIYNEAYAPVLGSKHPDLQGQDPWVLLAEVWEHFDNIIKAQRISGKAVMQAGILLLLNRHGMMEETYFNYKFTPIIGPDGWVVGTHCTCTEITDQIISERRLKTTQNLGVVLSKSRTINDLWAGIVHGLEVNEYDIPTAVLYSITEQEHKKSTFLSDESLSTSKICKLEHCIGINAGHALAPSTINFDHDESFLVSFFREAAKQLKPVAVPLNETICGHMADSEWRGHGVPDTIVICPIRELAFLVIALNPRRPYDAQYQDFINVLTQQITSLQLSAILLREEVERRARIANQEALARAKLTRELSESETKFVRFATRAPIGLAVLRADGFTITANDLWRELCQLPIGSDRAQWHLVLENGEIDRVSAAWDEVLSRKVPVDMTVRMKKRWQAPEPDEQGNPQTTPRHILLAMHPDFDEEGEVETIMSCVSDISGLKWTDAQLRKKMDQAIELKKQQEKFIDMTSHEMRNPLSALIGCADEISRCLSECRASLHNRDDTFLGKRISQRNDIALELIDEAAEAANTIIYCAMHQKRIVDDILTVSKLDSELLVVSPEASRPIDLLRHALKMFDSEMKRAEIKQQTVEQESLEVLGIYWTLLDPSRVLQIFINLMTNAIKFTRTEDTRAITVTLGASLEDPSLLNEFGVYYAESKTHLDQTASPEWGDGEIIYLSIAVEDTGRGMSEDEMQKLFNLFQQASPKTYTQYGGSGLGLFICRQLVEMQGGKIGVKSVPGKGSTFQFYIKTRRTVPSPGIVNRTKSTNVQLMIREDALQEACGAEIPAWQNQIKAQKESIVPMISPAILSPDSLAILVVEDNYVNQTVVSKQLRREGHVVHVASHGEEALEFIRKTMFHPQSTGGYFAERLDVVLMDLEMPVMDGLTCVKRIREMQKNGQIIGHVPVIAVTANARTDQIQRCFEAGMDDVTTKPYRIQDMLKQIRALLRKYTISKRKRSDA